VPVATIFILMAYSFHPGNMTAHLDSAPVSGIFTAVGTAGIIFSFLGFQQAIALAGETRNPGKYVPIALIAGAPPGLLKALGRLMMPEGKFRVIFNTQQALPWLVDWTWAAGRANVQRLKWKVPFGIGGALVGPCLELQLYLAMVMGAFAKS
jgi:amino acid transporter